MAKRKMTKAERLELEREHDRVVTNARRTRELAEKAQARLDKEKARESHSE